ncbi:major facilitator superfamily MFS_1 [Catenulispora acidiphila DSM 44928]|uniref:Major facilitator superfamily MFS_1 n=1 Tax=Catenulispora acidiphila (strain DSM 44928 / JCM 14897 / NBRC 102108 / NRRL B-24433 / ID139908) TaxID=479433 RepID=C7Q986_CATAD|nr:MFS transporter [Catenulispora acidiphila]ACU72406.1 major facilitator superfamily MFS_1 [Catenulispora acidiphila DSM 44928]
MTTSAAVADPASAFSERAARRAVWLVLSATFVVSADISIVAVAAPPIQRGLHASSGDIELTVAAYQIAYAALLITGGRLGDIFGRRALFTWAFAGFVLTSAACGLATSPGQLVAFRALQGVTAAMLSPQVMATIQIMLPPEKRAAAFGAQGAMLSLATVIGPVFAGLLYSGNIMGLSWRPIFLVNVPFGLAAIWLGRRYLPSLRNPEAKSLDLPGTCLVVLALVALMTPLSLGEQYGWPLWCWLSLAASPVLILAFLKLQQAEERRGGSPLLPTDLWRDRAFRTGVVLFLLAFSGVVSFFLYYFTLIQTAYNVSTLWAAVTTIPVGIGTIALSAASGRLVRAWGGRRVASVGAIVCCFGALSMFIPVVAVTDSSLALWSIPSQLVLGSGIGMLFAPLLSVVLAGIRSTHAGAAAGLLVTMQIAGGALGVSAMGVLFNSRLPGGSTDHASHGQLSSAMVHAMLYNPVSFLAALLVILVLPRTVRSAGRAAGPKGTPAGAAGAAGAPGTPGAAHA